MVGWGKRAREGGFAVMEAEGLVSPVEGSLWYVSEWFEVSLELVYISFFYSTHCVGLRFSEVEEIKLLLDLHPKSLFHPFYI